MRHLISHTFFAHPLALKVALLTAAQILFIPAVIGLISGQISSI